MKRSGGKPIPITQDEFESGWWSHSRSTEYEQLKAMEVGEGLMFKCRWNHLPKFNRCSGRSFFRNAANRLNVHFKISHGDGTISVLRDK